jgi:N-methylhydantoinase A
MPGALIPARPGVLSAWGMATADALRDHVRTVLEPLDAWDTSRRASAYAELATLGRAELVDAGHGPRAIEHEHVLDLRYRGQSYELSLAEPGPPARRPRRTRSTPGRARRKTAADDVARRFHERHAALYGYRIDERELELVGLRVRSIARRTAVDTDGSARAPRSRAAPAHATLGTRKAWFQRALSTPVVARDARRPGHRLAGPALVEEFSGTTLVPPRWTARVTRGHHLWLTRD